MKTTCKGSLGLKALPKRCVMAVSLALAAYGLVSATLAGTPPLPVYSIFQGQQFMQVGDMVSPMAMRPAVPRLAAARTSLPVKLRS